MTAILGRFLLRFLAGLSLLLIVLWLATPLWITPLGRALLAGADVELVTLAAGRPRLSGWSVERLVLRVEGTRLALRDATLHWHPSGELRRLRVEQLQMRMEPGADDAAPAPGPLPDPAALLAALPVARVEIAAAAIEVPAAGLRFVGELAATTTQAQATGRLTGPALASALDLRGTFTDGERLALRLTDAAGTELLEAGARLAVTAGRLAASGELKLASPLLPTLIADAPAVQGTLLLALRVAEQESALDLLPGTKLTLRGEAPRLDATLAPAAPWTLSLREGRIASRGTLGLVATATLPSDGDGGASELAARLRLTALGGSRDALRFAADGHLAITADAISAAGDLTLAAELRERRMLALAPGTGVRDVELEHASADLRLDGVAVELVDGAQVELSPPGVDAAAFTARAGALSIGARVVDLTSLSGRGEVAGSAAAPRLRFELDGAGLALRAQATVPAGHTELEVREARAAFGPATLPSAIAGALLPEVAWREGTLTVDALRWPPAASTPPAVRVEALGLATPMLEFSGLDARLELAPGADAATLTLDGGRLAALEAGALRAEQADFSLRGRLPAWGLDAAAAGELPQRLQVEELELHGARIATDAGSIDALAVTGGAEVDATGVRADLAVTAPTLTATLPGSDLRCALELRAPALRLRNCGLALLGGRIEVPAAEVRLDTLSGYLPVALQGLDLGAVLLLMQDDALEGDGVLDGALPVRLAEGVATVRDGYVGARPPGGRLRYAADAGLLERLNQPGLSLAMAALGDFRYRRLGAFIDYETDGTLGLRVRLAGASPDVENGRPIDFNLTVTQNLPLLLQSLRLSQTIGDAIERRLEERNAPR